MCMHIIKMLMHKANAFIPYKNSKLLINYIK